MRKIIGLLSMPLLACSAVAQSPSGAKPQWVEIVSTPIIKVSPNGQTKSTLQFRVKPGFHINSHTPHSDLLIPTELVTPEQQSLRLQPQYPEGRDITLPFDQEKIRVYTGDFAINVNALANGASVGKATLPAELKYQACNDNSCFPPKSLKFEVEVQVAR